MNKQNMNSSIHHRTTANYNCTPNKTYFISLLLHYIINKSSSISICIHYKSQYLIQSSLLVILLFMQITYSQDIFIYVSTSLTIDAAESYCQQQYSTSLASIHDDSQNENAAQLCLSEKCAIGLNDKDIERGSKEDGWVWTDNSPYDYKQWNDNEPNNFGTGEDCVEIYAGSTNRYGKWNDNKCTGSYAVPFLCNAPTPNPTEYPTKPTGDPTPAPTDNPTPAPTIYPTPSPTNVPSQPPTISPTRYPTTDPTVAPSTNPTTAPTLSPSLTPSISPTVSPTMPTIYPTAAPSLSPTDPSKSPSNAPTQNPTNVPSISPTYSPSISPSVAPSYSPSNAPSQFPTYSPSNAPTQSPTTCPDFGLNYTAIDGQDHILNPYDYVNYVVLGTNPTKNVSLKRAYWITQTTLGCRNPDGCDFYCNHSISCLQTIYHCDSEIGCNIHCNAPNSCMEMIIFAKTYSTTSITIICDADEACKDLNVTIDGIQAAEIHCVADKSCNELKATFSQISSKNNTNTFVACYVDGGCEDLLIIADGPYTQLRMYGHSENVKLNNGYGFVPELNTVSCGTNLNYIKYEKNSAISIDDIVKQEYPLKSKPCQGVIIQCPDANNTAEQCSMQSQYITIDNTHPRYHNAQCLWVLIQDITRFICDGGCLISPTEAPTPSPSNFPSETPSVAPSYSPSIAPSSAPTSLPSMSPSIAPTVSPTLNPTFPPTNYPTQNPTFSPTLNPTLFPTQFPTNAPSQSPTRNPTDNIEFLYDSWTDIIYIFGNLTDYNYDWILNNSNNNAVSYIMEIIESNYFSEQLESYELFQVKAMKINQIDYTDSSLFTKEVLSDKINGRGDIEMHIKSRISYNEKYANYIISTSQSIKWALSVTAALRQSEYFQNPYITFSVANSSDLFRDFATFESSFDYAFYSLTGFLGACIIIALFAKIHNSRNWGTGNRKGCVPVDNANWTAMIIYGLQIYDIFSDINLTYEIFTAIMLDQANDADCECEDDPEKWDTLQEYILVISAALSLLFLLLPYGLNIYYAAKLPNTDAIKRNITARTWFEQYQGLFILLVVISGGCYPALRLVSSNLFGISVLNAGLSSFELTGLSDIRVITTVLTENGPQLFVQIMYSYSVGTISQNTILAFSTSVMSIIASILNYFINKDKKGAVFDVFYYFELTAKEKLTKSEKIHIKKRKGIKLALAKQIVKIYPDVDIAHFEIGYVTIRKNNFVIRICQHLHEQDLGQNHQNDLLNAKDLDTIKKESDRIKEELKPFKNYCYELFAAHRDEITDIIYQHYFQLNRGTFQLRYHKEYPAEKLSDKIFGKQRSTNIRDLIRAASLNNTKSLESYENDMNSTRKTNNNRNELVLKHRNELKRGFEVLVDQIEKYKVLHGENEYIPNRQINEWITILQTHCIHHTVIDDIMHVALESGLYSQRPRCVSDIDSSDESVQLFEEDEEYRKKQYKIKKRRAIELEVRPDWFRQDTIDSDKKEKEGKQTNIKMTNMRNKKNKNKNKNKNNRKNLKRNIELSITLPRVRSPFNYQLSNTDSEADEDDTVADLEKWANQ